MSTRIRKPEARTSNSSKMRAKNAEQIAKRVLFVLRVSEKTLVTFPY